MAKIPLRSAARRTADVPIDHIIGYTSSIVAPRSARFGYDKLIVDHSVPYKPAAGTPSCVLPVATRVSVCTRTANIHEEATVPDI